MNKLNNEVSKQSDIYIDTKEANDTCTCPICQFEQSYLAKEISSYTDGINKPTTIDAKELLRNLKHHAYKPQMLPKSPANLANQLCKLIYSLHVVLGIDFKYFQDENNRTFVIFIPSADETHEAA